MISNMFFNILRGNAKKINIAVTDRCNLKCSICAIWQKPQSKELTLDDFTQFFKKTNWHWMGFTGGEPFLRNDLLSIIESAMINCKQLHTISMVTNGYLTEKIVNTVSELLSMGSASSLYLSISLDGVEDQHDRLRGVKGSFENAMMTFNELKKISEYGFKVHFEYTVSKLNQGKLMDTITALNLTPNDFIVTMAQNSNFYYNQNHPVTPDIEILRKDIADFLGSYRLNSIHDYAQKLFLTYFLNYKRIPCVGGLNSFFMDAQGKIHSCIFDPNLLGSMKHFNKLKTSCKQVCYTPCEGYFSLLMNWRKTLWSLI